MSFPSGAQAENKTQRAGRQIGLVRVRNDGGIEQGGGFEGVFGQEIGSDQQSPLFGQLLIGQYQSSRTCSKRSRKRLSNLLVPLGELSARLRPEAVRLRLPEAP